MPDDAVGRRGDGRIAGKPPGLPRRDSDSVRAPMAAERAGGRGRAGEAIYNRLGGWSRRLASRADGHAGYVATDVRRGG